MTASQSKERYIVVMGSIFLLCRPPDQGGIWCRLNIIQSNIRYVQLSYNNDNITITKGSNNDRFVEAEWTHFEEFNNNWTEKSTMKLLFLNQEYVPTKVKIINHMLHLVTLDRECNEDLNNFHLCFLKLIFSDIQVNISLLFLI